MWRKTLIVISAKFTVYKNLPLFCQKWKLFPHRMSVVNFFLFTSTPNCYLVAFLLFMMFMNIINSKNAFINVYFCLLLSVA